MVDDTTTRHVVACEGFSAVVHQADGGWANPSPCTESDTRGVLEHVIGFHDVLLLRPTGTKPRSARKDDPVARWDLTAARPGGGRRRSSPNATTTLADDPSPDPTWSACCPCSPPRCSFTPGIWPARSAWIHDSTPELSMRVVTRWSCPTTASCGPPECSAPRYRSPERRRSGQPRLVAFLGRDPAWRPPADG